MRRQTELRTVGQQGTGGGTVHVKRTTGTAEPTGTSIATREAEKGLPTSFREMERWFEEAFNRPIFGMNWFPFRSMLHELGEGGGMSPSVDMYEERGELVVKAEMPGITSENLNVRVVDNNLVISAERSSEERVEEANYLRLERSHGSYSRALSLPDGLDTDHVRASLKDGVLEIRFPRSEKSTVKQITVA